MHLIDSNVRDCYFFLDSIKKYRVFWLLTATILFCCTKICKFLYQSLLSSTFLKKQTLGITQFFKNTYLLRVSTKSHQIHCNIEFVLWKGRAQFQQHFRKFSLKSMKNLTIGEILYSKEKSFNLIKVNTKQCTKLF